MARTSGQLASAFGSGFTAGVTDAQGFSPGNEQPGAISAVSTVTTLSKGTEWELSAQPIRNWNVTLNFATTNATHIQIDPCLLYTSRCV